MIRSNAETVQNTNIHKSCNTTLDSQEEHGNITDFSESDVGGDTTKVEFEDGTSLNTDNSMPCTIDVD